MKKLLIVSLLTLAMPSLAFASFDTSLRYGSSGPKVLELQEFLTDQGVYTGPITGNFFSLTLAGVKRFQTAQGVVPVSGFFGPITRGVADGILSQELAESDAEASTTPIVTQPKHTHMTDSTSTGGSSTPAPSTTAPAPAPTPAAPASQARIEIISIDNSKPLDEVFTVASSTVTNAGEATDPNSVAFLGAVVYGDDGQPINNAAVEVLADDAEQNKTLNGTGNQLGFPRNGVPYYPFSYLFKSAGDHRITFTTGGISSSVTLKAQ